MDTPSSQPLRDDVRFLGRLLGETLAAQEGQALFDTVERVRRLSKQARGGDLESLERLSSQLSAMPIEDAEPVARAFAHFLNLANIAEQHHRLRQRRLHSRDPSAGPEQGSVEETVERLLADGVTPDELYQAVCSQRIELVLTAHPTQVTRRTLLSKFARIESVLEQNDRADLTEHPRSRPMTKGNWCQRQSIGFHKGATLHDPRLL